MSKCGHSVRTAYINACSHRFVIQEMLNQVPRLHQSQIMFCPGSYIRSVRESSLVAVALLQMRFQRQPNFVGNCNLSWTKPVRYKLDCAYYSKTSVSYKFWLTLERIGCFWRACHLEEVQTIWITTISGMLTLVENSIFLNSAGSSIKN